MGVFLFLKRSKRKNPGKKGQPQAKGGRKYAGEHLQMSAVGSSSKLGAE